MSRKILWSAVLAVLILGPALFFLLRGTGDSPIPGGRTPPPSTPSVAKTGSRAGAKTPEGPGAAVPDALPEEAPEPARTPEGTAPVSLFGRVLEKDGGGIPGARLYALHTASWRETMKSRQPDFMGPQNPFEAVKRLRETFEKERAAVPQTESGEDGAYAFRGLEPGAYRLFVSHPEFLPHDETYADVEEEAPTERDVRLLRGYAITGRVVDASGKPVAKAIIDGTPSAAGRARGVGRMLAAILDVSDASGLLRSPTTESGEDGAFRLGGLEPIPHDLTVRKEGLSDASAWKIPVPSKDIVILLETGSVIEGRIVGADGAPVSGAALAATPRKDAEAARDPRAFLTGDAFDLEGRSTRRATSGADGTFEVAGLREDAYQVTFEATGHPRLQMTVEVRGPRVSLGDVVLPRGLSISGMVLDPNGQPIVGARVWVPPSERTGVVAFMEAFSPSAAIAETESGAGGRYVLDALPEGKHEVRASAEGYADGGVTGIEAGSRLVEIQLGAGTSIHGIVVDAEDGGPVVGARIQAGTVRAETDRDGRFVLRGLQEGRGMFGGDRIFLMVQHPEYEASMGSGRVPKGENPEPLRIELKRASLIFGRVVDETGRPAEGARVRISIPGLPQALMSFMPGGGGADQISDADGAFALSPPTRRMGPNAPSVDVLASHPSLGIGGVRAIPWPGEGEGWPELEIVLTTGAAIAGRVTGPTGEPVRGARIQAAASVPEDAEEDLRMMSSILPGRTGKVSYAEADGTYRIEGLHPGTYDLEVRATGYGPRRLEAIPVPEGTAAMDVVLEAGAAITGRVVASDGMPLSNIEVLAFLEIERSGDDARRMAREMRRMRMMGMGGTTSDRSDADGRFELADLPEGTFTVMARAKGYEPGEKGSVRPGETGLILTLARHGAIRGTVTDAETGTPVTSFQVQIVPSREFEDPMMVLDLLPRRFDDPEGAFLYGEVRPWTYTIRIQAAGYVPYRQEVVVRPAEEAFVRAVLQVGARVEGVVLEAGSGEPIPGVRITCMPQDTAAEPPEARFWSFGDDRVETDENGIFVKEGLSPGRYSCLASHPDYTLAGATPQFEAGATGTATLQIRMDPAGRVSGVIRNLPRYDPREENLLVVLTRIDGESSVPAEGTAGASREGGLAEPAEEEGDPTGEEGPARQVVHPPLQRMTPVNPNGDFSVDSVPSGRYRVELQRMVFRTREPTLSRSRIVRSGEERTPLGEVEVQPGRTQRVEFRVP